MKYWLSHLPLEVWVDCYRYPGISREELGRIVDRFSNRKYVEYLQFYLHDWGKRKLNLVSFNQYGVNVSLFREPYFLHPDIPSTPLPDNIKSFEQISISHFDRQTVNFLRYAKPILTNVKLELGDISPDNMDNLRIILNNMVPLLDGTLSLECDVCALPTVAQCFGTKLGKIKQLSLYQHARVDDEAAAQPTVKFLLNWLTSSGQDDNNNGPKWCQANQCRGYFEKITQAIRQQFFAAKTPCTFALILSLQQFVEFHLKNNIGEELHCVQFGTGFVQITRHPANCGTELQGWIAANIGKNHGGQIRICSPTVGLLDVTMNAPENEEPDQQQPSTSKKA